MLCVLPQLLSCQTTPDIKVQAVKRLGVGQVVLHGDSSFDVANKYAIQRAADEGMTFIPPYDDELVTQAHHCH